MNECVVTVVANEHSFSLSNNIRFYKITNIQTVYIITKYMIYNKKEQYTNQLDDGLACVFNLLYISLIFLLGTTDGQ